MLQYVKGNHSVWKGHQETYLVRNVSFLIWFSLSELIPLTCCHQAIAKQHLGGLGEQKLLIGLVFMWDCHGLTVQQLVSLSFRCSHKKFLVAMAVFLGPAGTIYFFSDWNFKWETFLIAVLPIYGVSVFLCQISVSKFMLNSIQFLVYSSFNFQCAFSKKTCSICFRWWEVACFCLRSQILGSQTCSQNALGSGHQETDCAEWVHINMCLHFTDDYSLIYLKWFTEAWKWIMGPTLRKLYCWIHWG